MANMLAPRIQFKQFAGQYLVGNLIATILAIIVALFVRRRTGSALITAISASATVTVIWYAYITLYYTRLEPFPSAVRHLVHDFGLAEALDTLFIRPVLMYVMPMFSGQAVGVLLASVLADVIYTAVSLNRQRHRILS